MQRIGRRRRDRGPDPSEIWPGHAGATSLTEQEWERYLSRVMIDPEAVGYLVETTPFGAVFWSETRRPAALVLGSADDSSPVPAQRVAREINQIEVRLPGRASIGLRGFLGAMVGLMGSLCFLAPALERFAPANNATAWTGMIATISLIIGGYFAAEFGERIRYRRQYRIYRHQLESVVTRMHHIGQLMSGHPSEDAVRTAVLQTMWAQPDSGVVEAGVDEALEEIEERLVEAVEAREERDAAVDQEISHLRDSAVLDDVPAADGLVDESWWGRRRAARARAEQEAHQRAEQRAAGARAQLVDHLEVDIEADRSVAREYRTRSRDS